MTRFCSCIHSPNLSGLQRLGSPRLISLLYVLYLEPTSATLTIELSPQFPLSTLVQMGNHYSKAGYRNQVSGVFVCDGQVIWAGILLKC